MGVGGGVDDDARHLRPVPRHLGGDAAPEVLGGDDLELAGPGGGRLAVQPAGAQEQRGHGQGGGARQARGEIAGERERRDEEARRIRQIEGKDEAAPHDGDGDERRQQQPQPRPGGEVLGDRRGRDDQGEDQKRAHGLHRFRHRDGDKDQEKRRQGAYRDAARARDVGIDAEEKEGAGDDRNHGAGGKRGRRGDDYLLRLKAENRAEQHADPHRAGGGAPRGGVQAQEQDPDAEHPGKDGADRHVAAAAPSAERPDRQGDGDAARKGAGKQVESGEHAAQAARECGVPEGVGGENLVAQDDEVADQARRHGDAPSRDESVAHELETEHVGQAHARTALRPRTAR